ncbi:hypothetical protein ACFQGT_09455 [Natrialbaceae archaeon GCM10025810]|uniref:hypothetical protein n=1 Tax=Halovalidus salilacus TaxID=3075124 RepID=UPI0036161B4E
MTTIRNLVSDVLGVGTTVSVDLQERDGRFVADHPNASSPMDLAVVEGVDRLEERPPDGPVEVEVVGRLDGGYVVGRLVGLERPGEAEDANGN